MNLGPSPLFFGEPWRVFWPKALSFGLAMGSSGPQGQTEALKALKGRAELRAADRSARRRREAPKQQRAATTSLEEAPVR